MYVAHDQQLHRNIRESEQRRRYSQGVPRQRLTRPEMDLRNQGLLDSTSSETETEIDDYAIQMHRRHSQQKVIKELPLGEGEATSLDLLHDESVIDNENDTQVQQRSSSAQRVPLQEVFGNEKLTSNNTSPLSKQLKRGIDEARIGYFSAKSIGTSQAPLEISSSSPSSSSPSSEHSRRSDHDLNDHHPESLLPTVEEPQQKDIENPLQLAMDDPILNDGGDEPEILIQEEVWGHIYYTQDSKGNRMPVGTKTWEQMAGRSVSEYSSSAGSGSSDESYVDENSVKRKRSSKQSQKTEPRRKKSKQIIREKRVKFDDIVGSLRPANQPPPKVWLPPREMREMGLKGLAQLEGSSYDPSFDSDKTNPWFRHSRHVARTDGRDNAPKPQESRSSMINRTSSDVHYPDRPVIWAEATEHNRLPFTCPTPDTSQTVKENQVLQGTESDGEGIIESGGGRPTVSKVCNNSAFGSLQVSIATLSRICSILPRSIVATASDVYLRGRGLQVPQDHGELLHLYQC